MISFKKSKSHFLAAIGTVLIHLLLLLFLSSEFQEQESSKLSDLDDLQIELSDITPDDAQQTPPGKDPLAAQKDQSSESISKEKGSQRPQQTAPVERTSAEQEAVALATPDTIVPPKPEEVKLVKIDSVKQAEKDSVIAAQIAQLQTIVETKPATTTKNNQDYLKQRERYQYYVKNYKNIRNFKKVYPYALKTREIMEKLNQQLSTMTDEGEKKKLIKETEKMLFKEYENAVRNMSTSQGKLLLKLIARETNKTGYQIVKEYKGTLPATFWYGVGKIFGTDLKSEFHKEQEDSVIENILTKYKNNDLY